MNRAPFILLLVVIACSVAGCARDASPDGENEVEIATIENSPTELRPIRKPPMIEFDRGPAPALEGEDETSDEEPSQSGESEESEAAHWTQDLPFSPKIAMDPIDGSKLSIRSSTPIAEYKGRVYYFSSEANKREFIRSPDEFLSGAFASY